MVLVRWVGRLLHSPRPPASEDQQQAHRRGMSSLRTRCLQHLSALELPRTFDLEALCDRVAASRGRALRLQPLPHLGVAAPCGLWVAVAHTDYVFYETGMSQLHADHIILHELCHMICGHLGEEGFTRSISVSLLLPSLDTDMVRAVLGRVKYSTDQEREAELLASLIRSGGLDIAPEVTDQRDRKLVDAVEEALNPPFGGTYR